MGLLYYTPQSTPHPINVINDVRKLYFKTTFSRCPIGGYEIISQIPSQLSYKKNFSKIKKLEAKKKNLHPRHPLPISPDSSDSLAAPKVDDDG